MGYILIIFSSFLTSLIFAIGKVYQLWEGSGVKEGYRYTALTGIFTAIIFLAINKFKLGFAPYSLIMCSLQAILVTSYTILSFQLLKMGTMALYTIFLMTGGMIVPYFTGIIFLDESSTIMNSLGLIVIIAGVVLTKFSKEKVSAKQLMLCIIVFFLNGGVSVVSKFHQIETFYATVPSIEFTIWGSLTRTVLSVIALMFLKKNYVTNEKKETSSQKNKWVYLCVVSAIFTGFSSILQLNGASDIPATVLYPLITGGAIVFTSLLGAICFKEKLSKNVIASILLCTTGLVIFCI